MSRQPVQGIEPRRMLTTGRVFVLLCHSTVVWFLVAQYIRYAGPAGAFTGRTAISTYIATFLLTIPLNWFARRIVGLPAESMLSVAAVSAILPYP